MKKGLKLGTILLASILLVGCTQTSEPSIESTPSESTTPEKTYNNISEIYNGKDDDTFLIKGVVAQFLYGYNGATSFYIADDTGSMLVYADIYSLTNLKVGYTVEVSGYLDHYQSGSDASVGTEIGYYGALELVATADFIILDNTVKDIPATSYTESRIKTLSETSFQDNDLTTKFFKVKTTIEKAASTGYTNYYFNDLSMDDSIYAYSTISGSDYSWLDEYDGQSREAIIAIHSMRPRDRAWRLVPIQVLGEVSATDEDVAGFALDRLEKQVNDTYSQTVSIELLKQDTKLLNESTVTYTSSNAKHTITSSETGENYLLNIDGTELGTFTLTITLVYKEKTYTRDISILVKEAVVYDTITIAEVKAAEEGTEVYVEGIYVKFTVVFDGLYLADNTGILAVYYANLSIDDYTEGEKMIFKGTVYRDFKEDNYEGYIRLANAELLEHDSQYHEWDKTIVSGTTTVTDLYENPSSSKVTNIYLVNGYVVETSTTYYSYWRLYEPDGSKYMNVYCSDSVQLSWLRPYENETQSYYVYLRDFNNGNKNRIEILGIA